MKRPLKGQGYRGTLYVKIKHNDAYKKMHYWNKSMYLPQLRKGDSIYKEANSLIIKVYRIESDTAELKLIMDVSKW